MRRRPPSPRRFTAPAIALLPLVALLPALLPALLLACGGGGPADAGPVAGTGSAAASDGPPIVLITLEGLRADAVSALGPWGEGAPAAPALTPALDAFAAEADLAVAAVAPSSWVLPSLATLFTGLKPWAHQVIVPSRPELNEELPLLPRKLAERGYRSFAYVDSRWLTRDAGYGRGFDQVRPFRRGERAEAHLASLGGGAELIWIHLAAPSPPYLRRDWLLDRLPPGDRPRGLPERLDPDELERYFSPSVELPPAERRRLLALYRLNVAWADVQVGRLLAALEGSGQGERALVAVVSLYGQELGEHGQIASGGSLGRSLIEVPLLLRLPPGAPAINPPPAGSGRIATARLWATLVEAAAAELPPGVAQSLFRGAPPGVLSELYLSGTVNRFSLVQGEYQLHWQTRFAPPGGAYYRARLVRIGRRVRPALRRSPDAILDELARAYAGTLPLSGRGYPPRLTLERWLPDGGTEEVVDPELARRMAEELRRRWSLFVDVERTPQRQAGRLSGEGL